MLRLTACRGRGSGLAVVVALALTIAACTAVERQQADQREQLLSAAGFDVRVADTPQKLASLQAMKQRKVIRREKNGQLRYLFADAEFCHCLFVGDEQNYQTFQNLAVKQQIAWEERESALDNQLDSQWAYDSWSSLNY